MFTVSLAAHLCGEFILWCPAGERQADEVNDAPFVTALPAVDGEFAERIRGAVSAVPHFMREALQAAGWRCLVVDQLVTALPELQGVQPRGWPSGFTWDQVDAVHIPQHKLVVIAKWRVTRTGERILSQRIPGVVWHEIGHAWDVYARSQTSTATLDNRFYSSQSSAFLEAYQRDVASWDANLRKDWIYYLQEDGAGRQEVFAECFAVLLGQGSDPRPSREFLARFPSAFAAMRAWYESHTTLPIFQQPDVPLPRLGTTRTTLYNNLPTTSSSR